MLIQPYNKIKNEISNVLYNIFKNGDKFFMDEKLNKILDSFNEILDKESFKLTESDKLEELENKAYTELDIKTLIGINTTNSNK